MMSKLEAVDASLAIGELARRTGVSEATLRAWERRHGFPAPARLPGGHRRYDAADVDRVLRVADERELGMPLAEAIRRATAVEGQPAGGPFAAVRSAVPELAPQPLPKPALVRLSHAIENEVASWGRGGVLAGAFQRPTFFRQAEPRWIAMSRSVAICFVLAGFRTKRIARRGPRLLPLPPDSPLDREWALVWDGPLAGACLLARELPSPDRVFDTVWSVDPAIVRRASRALSATASLTDRGTQVAAERVLDDCPLPDLRSQLRLGAAISARALAAGFDQADR